jgi:Ca2+-binding RTX toxin-like protein
VLSSRSLLLRSSGNEPDLIGVSCTKNVNDYERKIMKNRTRSKRFAGSAARRALIAAFVGLVMAAVAGIMAGSGSAAAPDHSGYGGYPPKVARFETPKLEDGALVVRGTKASDKIALRLAAGDPSVLQVDMGDDASADFSFERSKVAKIDVKARAGNDLVRMDESNGTFTDTIQTTIEGGDGNDTIAGGKGVETLLGGRANDSIDGNGGNDRALLGAGNDTFIWDPGDGSDTIEGQAGRDTMLFNGASGTDQVELSANGSRLKFFRVQGNITMDTAGVERVDFNALGGADRVTVDNLAGTDVRSVNVDLAGAPGGAMADGAADQVIVNATDGNDAIGVSGDAAELKVSGLAATTRVRHSEVAKDRLDVNTLAGTDSVSSAGLAAGAIQLFVDGLLVP